MSISLSDASLKTYKQLLPASLAIMKKAEKHFTDEGANVNDLAEIRMIEDMAPLSLTCTPRLVAETTFHFMTESVTVTGETLFLDGGMHLGR